jgi:chromosome segregation ATPase
MTGKSLVRPHADVTSDTGRLAESARHVIDGLAGLERALREEQAAHAETRAELDAVNDRLKTADQGCAWLEQRLALLEAKCDHLTAHNAALSAEMDGLATMLEGSGGKVRRVIAALRRESYGAPRTRRPAQHVAVAVAEDDGAEVPRFLTEPMERPN